MSAAPAPAPAPTITPATDTKAAAGGDVYLVIGGTGKIGTAFVALAATDARAPVVRIATRNVDSNDSKLLVAMSPNVKPVLFDTDKPDTMAKAFAGVTKVMLIPPFVSDMAQWHTKVMAEAKKAGSVQHVVKVSVTGARAPSTENPPGRIPLGHWQGEEAVRAAGIPNTSIRPTIFAQHFGMMAGVFKRGEDSFYLPTGSAKIAFVDCRDIAAFGYALLSAPDAVRKLHSGQSYELTGPAGITASQIADILSFVAERKISWVDTEKSFSDHCKALNIPDGIKAVYHEAAGGWFSKVDNETFIKLTGHTTTPFAKFAEDNKYMFIK